jgi:hypothetical protein
MTTAVGTLPNTFIVGAPKSGTTFLAAWLALSDDVFGPAVKEPGFFMEEHHYRRGPAHCATAYYRDARNEPIVLDSTPWYLYPASVPARIAATVGTADTRIIIVLREPVSRTFSMYFDQVGRCRETRRLEDVVTAELRIDDPVAELAREAGPELFSHYVLCGRYLEPVRRYVDTFGPENVSVILAEEMWGDPDAVRERLDAFLRVRLPPAPARPANPASRAQFGPLERVLARIEASRSPLRSLVGRMPAVAGGIRTGIDAVTRWNRVPTRYPVPDPGLRRELSAWFAPANRRLETYLQRSVTQWW